jgi:hypothetical protein
MSSRSGNSATSSNTTATDCSAKLDKYISELTTLARQTLNSERTYRRHFSPVLLNDDYSKLQARISMYFTKHAGADSVAEFAVDRVMEIKTLMRLIETGLARSHCKIEWPVGFEDEEKARKRAY